MADCVLSTQNRFYVELESTYGIAAAIAAGDRISAVKLGIQQEREIRRRRDKTGGRTYQGISPGSRKQTKGRFSRWTLIARPLGRRSLL